MTLTSYNAQWRRGCAKARPDFDTRSHTEFYVDPDGRPLFSVTTTDGVPSEGIFTLIEHAPRLRDELDTRLASDEERS